MARSELAKQRERINKTIRQAIKRGYIFPYQYAKGKGFSQAFGSTVAELSKIKPADIYERLRYFDPLADKFISGTERRQAERKLAYIKGQKTRQVKRGLQIDKPYIEDVVLQQIQDKIAKWQPKIEWQKTDKHGWSFADLKEQDKNRLESILQAAINAEGRIAVAQRLQANAIDAIELCDKILYGSGEAEKSVEANFVKLTEILKGGALDIETARQVSDLAEVQATYENS